MDTLSVPVRSLTELKNTAEGICPELSTTDDNLGHLTDDVVTISTIADLLLEHEEVDTLRCSMLKRKLLFAKLIS